MLYLQACSTAAHTLCGVLRYATVQLHSSQPIWSCLFARMAPVKKDRCRFIIRVNGMNWLVPLASSIQRCFLQTLIDVASESLLLKAKLDATAIQKWSLYFELNDMCHLLSLALESGGCCGTTCQCNHPCKAYMSVWTQVQIWPEWFFNPTHLSLHSFSCFLSTVMSNKWSIGQKMCRSCNFVINYCYRSILLMDVWGKKRHTMEEKGNWVEKIC